MSGSGPSPASRASRTRARAPRSSSRATASAMAARRARRGRVVLAPLTEFPLSIRPRFAHRTDARGQPELVGPAQEPTPAHRPPHRLLEDVLQAERRRSGLDPQHRRRLGIEADGLDAQLTAQQPLVVPRLQQSVERRDLQLRFDQRSGGVVDDVLGLIGERLLRPARAIGAGPRRSRPGPQSSTTATRSSAGRMDASSKRTSTEPPEAQRSVSSCSLNTAPSRSSARTKVPLPWVVVTRPRSSRMLTARRTVMGLTPNSSRSCDSVGSWSPGRYTPAAMRSVTAFAILRYAGSACRPPRPSRT